MALITEIYEKYKIMSNLQLHQLRVAAVAKKISDNLVTQIDKAAVVEACLLHDMGNIIKFDLDYFPQFLEPEGLEYWQKVKNEFIDKYGKDEHEATLEIVRGIGASRQVLECIDSIGFNKIKNSYFDGSIEQKVCNYSDMRVGPDGVVTIYERLTDGKKRYEHRKKYLVGGSVRKEILKELEELEDQILSKPKIQPSDITDESIEPLIKQLRTYEIRT
jgi:HD superfamily phosphodiesterase